MRTPRIAAVATATPTQRFTQTELLEIFGYEDPQRRGFFELQLTNAGSALWR